MINKEKDIAQLSFKRVTDEIERSLPKKLKFLRIKSGLTTFDVGTALNKTASAITMWETGKAYPDILTLFKLRELYNISDLNDFFDENQAIDLKSLIKTEQELINLWRRAPSSVRASIKNILKHIKV